MVLTAVLLSGGKGSRMQSDLPKQYLKVLGKDIARYSFDLFEKSPLIDHIVVVCEKEFEKIFEGAKKPCLFVCPGKERQDSLKNAINELRAQKTPASEDWILVHDAARPCLQNKDLEEVIFAAKKYGAALLANPLVASLKKVDKEGFVINSPSREDIWIAQTPQVMKRQNLEKAIKRFPNLFVTDDCAYIEALQEAVKIVAADPSNIKVTHAQDLALAAFYLQSML